MHEANYWDKRSFKLRFLHNCAALISVIAVFVLRSRGRFSRPKIVSSLLTEKYSGAQDQVPAARCQERGFEMHFSLKAMLLRRLKSDLLNPKFGSQKSALL